jgi:uncharacterized protein YbaP (TraB family)
MPGRKLGLCVALVLLTTYANSQKKHWPNTFLWRITGNGLSKPSFLYGTIHLTDKKLFNFGDSLYYYLERSEGLNIEIDGDSLVTASVKMWTERDNGRMLKNILKKNEYDKYADKLSKKLNKPADKITTKDIANLKNRKLALEYQKGEMSNFMDFYLYGVAKKQGKQVGGIEDVEDQLYLINEEFENSDLADVLSDSIQQQDGLMLKTLKEVYIQENLAGVEALFDELKDESLKHKMLAKRNLKMAVRMDSIARLRSTFFAVGVAHLPGDSGLITLLQKNGFTVQPVFSSKKTAASNYTFKAVETAWKPYTHSTNLYSAKFPGTPQPMDAFKQVMDMQYYYDISTSKTYYTAFVNTVANENKKDSLFNEMIKRMAADGKVVSKKNIVKQGYEGRDVILKVAGGEVLRVNIFIAQDIVYMSLASAKVEGKINDVETQAFFNSFTMSPKSSVVKPYVIFKDTISAFSVLLPPNTAEREEPATAETGFEKQITSTDYSTGVSFVVSVSDVKPGLYLPSDTNTIALVKKNLRARMEEDVVSKETVIEGRPALVLNGTGKNESFYFRTVTVLRGNRNYSLIAVTKKSEADNSLIDTVFNSFKFLDYSHNKWNRYTAPDSTFEAWLPAPFIQTSPVAKDIADTAIGEQVAVNEFLSHDNNTSTSYHMHREHFDEYYSINNDSTFFKEQAKQFVDKGDSIVSFKLLTVANNKASDVVITNDGSSFNKKFRFILHGDTLYKLYTYSPKWLNDGNIEKYFSEFSFSSTAPATTLFTDKTQRLVSDLQSADSVTFTKASGYLYDAKFNKSSLQQLQPLLIKPLRDFNDDKIYSQSNDHLVDAIVKIADSSTVDFVLKNYHELKGKPAELQYQLLRLLVEMENPYAADAARKLLMSPSPPSGDAQVFSRSIDEYLPFAKSVFPQILSFTKDTTAALAYAHLITILIDSSLISKDEVAGSLPNFITAADLQKKKLGTNTYDYDYGLLGILDLFAKIDNAESRAQLQSFSKVANMHVKNYTTGLLLENNVPVAVETIAKLAASDEYRSSIYEELEKVKKTSLFPATYLNQKMLAASYAFNHASDDYSPRKVEFVTEKTAKFKGTIQKFYLFKVSFEEEDETPPMLAIAGPFSLNTKKVTSDNEATGLYWEKPFSPKSVNTHFNAFLKQVEFPGEAE